MMKNFRHGGGAARQNLLAAVLGAAMLAGGASAALGAGPAAPSSLPDLWVAAADAPASKDALFGDAAPAAKDAPPGDSTSASKDALFGTGLGLAPKSPWRGYVRGELARTYASPSHWSKMLVSSELDAEGAISANVKYHLGARFDYDFVYDATDFYPPDVKRDQRANFLVRENYLDVGAGDWDYRLGRQQIVWGEMVGLFFADVVSAKDLREFILPDFDQMRIPQWAARAEYFKGDFHLEAIWIPVASYDDIGKPGAEFFPAPPPPPPGFATRYDNEQFPDRSLAHTNAGLRLSYLKDGWDMSGFYYHSMDAQPTFYRTVVTGPDPAWVYQAQHDRIDQVGGTLSKDLGFSVLKAEAVYTHGRSFNTLDPTNADGVVRQNTLDVIGGLDFTLPADTRLNIQIFNRTYFDHDPNIVQKQNEPGTTLLLNHKFGDNFEAEMLWVTSLIRNDWMLRPRVTWRFRRDWQWRLGVDVFDGPPLGLFGQYNDRDRVYSEVRYSF
ncbi:MAG: hypothetical protein JSS46_11520 [Proteobacteria bacterium]|nr:hypothetical protein [Pseudomonadota bacterium]